MTNNTESLLEFCGIAQEGVIKKYLDWRKKTYDKYHTKRNNMANMNKYIQEVNDPKRKMMANFINLKNLSTRKKENDIFNLGEGDINTLTNEDMKLLAPMQSEFKKCLDKLEDIAIKYANSQDLVEIEFHCPKDSIAMFVSMVNYGIYAFPISYEPYYKKLGPDPTSIDGRDYSEVEKIIDNMRAEIEEVLDKSKFKGYIDVLKDNTDTPYFVHNRFYYEIGLVQITDPKYKNIYK